MRKREGGQRSFEMIVGSRPACRCVECVGERRTEWEERSGGGVRLCVCVCVCATVCVRLLSCVERLPVSGRLSWVFFIWSVGAVSTA